MPTSEPLIDTPFAKRVAIASSLVPGALLIWDAFRHQLGVNEVNFAIRTTGLIGLILITLALLVTPLRAITGWNRLISIRRNLGVMAFAYLAAHVLIFVILDRQGSLSSTIEEIVKRRYLWFGTSALVLMIPLALTSTDAMVLKLGARRWKRLQRLVYAIAIAAAIHYYLLVKSDTRQPLAFAAVIGALLVYRLGAHYFSLRREARAARTGAVKTTVRPQSFWSGELRIARIFTESPDVKTFRFGAVDGGPLPFTHVPGQYLNVVLSIDGKRVNRSYTIASPPTRTAYCEISVKRTEGGYGSRYVHDRWREGQRVRVSAPAGRFVFAGAPTDAPQVVLIAGGIGITPLISVVRGLTDRAWSGDIYLLYSVRTVQDIVFREELGYLQARFPNLHVQILVSRDPDTMWNGRRGQITRDVITEFVPDLGRGPVLLCGPGPMMTAMREILVGIGVPDEEILQEVFISRPATDLNDAPDAVSGTDANVADALADGEPAAVSFTRAGKVIEVARDQTLLDAAEACGIDVPFECRSGICGQCKTRLAAGRVRMDVQDALSAMDRARGFILACQARALTNLEVEA